MISRRSRHLRCPLTLTVQLDHSVPIRQLVLERRVRYDVFPLSVNRPNFQLLLRVSQLDYAPFNAPPISQLGDSLHLATQVFGCVPDACCQDFLLLTPEFVGFDQRIFFASLPWVRVDVCDLFGRRTDSWVLPSKTAVVMGSACDTHFWF